MRKWTKMLLLAGLFAVLLCGSAFAAGEKGMHSVVTESGKNVHLTAKTASNGTPSTAEVTIDDAAKTLYVDAERVEMEVTDATAGTEYLVFVLKDNATVPNVDNIVYIDQKSGTAAGTFDLYPSNLANGSYNVFMSTTSAQLAKVGSFQYYAPFRPGFVDEDDRITATDAQWTLQMAVGNRAGTPMQQLAANVDGDQKITATDAQWILQAAVGNREL